MLFALICTDKPASLELRLRVRPEHVAYLNGLGAKMKTAGPFLDSVGEPNGSLVIVEADDIGGAHAIAAGDPYAKAGLFAATDIRPWRWTIKNPEA